MSWAAVHVLILIMIANSVPVLLARIMGGHLAQPVDFGRVFPDGRPLLGTSKTWRGFAGAIIATAMAAPLLGYSAALGAAIGLFAMLGDMLSSFSKRRLRLPSSAQAPLLDQIPESLLPALLCKYTLTLSWLDVAAIALAFMALEVVLSVLFFRLGIRKQPY